MPIYRVFQTCTYNPAGHSFLMRSVDYATALERGKYLCGSAFHHVELSDICLPILSAPAPAPTSLDVDPEPLERHPSLTAEERNSLV
jgi:hypothetical protein